MLLSWQLLQLMSAPHDDDDAVVDGDPLYLDGSENDDDGAIRVSLSATAAAVVSFVWGWYEPMGEELLLLLLGRWTCVVVIV